MIAVMPEEDGDAVNAAVAATAVAAKIRIAIRGFVNEPSESGGANGGRLLFEDNVAATQQELESLIPALAEKHGRALASHELHMIEIEFLDEPDVQTRFFRFGTDPTGMVRPVAIDLSKLCGNEHVEKGWR